ncbi:COQ9 family protein [Dongia mobilis]|nr:COQ9 family protein [Dongia mobilis]
MSYDRDDDRERLAAAILPHVPFDGWSETAMKAGAADLGLDLARAVNAFPGGMAEVLAFAHRQADRRMEAALADEATRTHRRLHERIAHAIRLRLSLVEGEREAIRAGLSFLLLPENATLGPKLLYGTVDSIWHAVGDRSTDFSFYSKRAILAAVYSATLLHWLGDKSAGHAATWAFLDRRLAEVMKIPAAKQRIKGLFGRLPNPLALLQRDAVPGRPALRRRRMARR